MANNFNISDQPGAGVSAFLGLSDTPGSYAAAASDFVRVNAGMTALEFLAGGGAGVFSRANTLLTSGDVSVTALVFTDIPGAITPSFTPFAGEIVLVYCFLACSAPAGGDTMSIDLQSDNSGAFVSLPIGATNGIIHIERDEQSCCFAAASAALLAVPTLLKLRAKVLGGTGIIRADITTSPFVLGVLRV